MNVLRTSLVCALILSTSFLFAQRGKNNSLTVNTSPVIVNEYTSLTANAFTGNTTITVAASSLNANARFTGPLAAGDLIMIIQIQGASMIGTLVGTVGSPQDTTWGKISNYNNCGWYEFAQVRSVPNGTTIQLDCGLSHDYSTGGTNHTEIVRVPRYTSATINNTGVLTCDAWNGTIGGVLAIEVLNNTVINTGGSIDATGKGFRGGFLTGDNVTTYGVGNVSSTDPTYGARRGEGIVGYDADYDPLGGRYGMGAAGNSGGGGNAHNGGGGGGANGGIASIWTGWGIPDLTGVNYNTAWSIEPPNNTINNLNALNSSGGGKGGYTFSSSNQNAITLPPSNINWGGDHRNQGACGLGGRPLDYSTGRLFLGGGGGAGDQNNAAGGVGGNGGGLIYIMNYGTVSGAGQIISNGSNGAVATGPAPANSFGGNDAGGGAGAGGTVVLNSVGTISGISITTNGGKGGDQLLTRGTFFFGSINEAEGPGGGGGGGYIAISNGAITRTANGGMNGTTNSDALTEFLPNGATKGCPGTTNAAITNFTITANPVTICSGNSANLTAVLTGTVPPGTTVIWYDQAVGGNVLGTGTNYTTPVLTVTDTFYVGTCPGTYTVMVIVTVSPPISASVTPSAPQVCAGGNVQLTASGGVTYSWAPATGLSNATISNPVCTPTATTTYTVYVTNGCTGTATCTVTVNPAPTATVSPASATLCSGNSVQLTAGGGTSYSWAPATGLSNSTIANPLASPTVTTTYTVTVTNAGCSSTATVTITVNPGVTATVNPSSATICSGSNVQLNSGGGTAYSWTPASGLSNNTIANPVANPTVTTTYTVLVSNVSGCTDTATVTVTVNPAVTATVTPAVTSICSGSNVTLTAGGGTTYSWAPATGLSSTTAFNPVASPTTTTTYTVFVTNSSGCTGTAVSTITVNPVPTATVSPSAPAICPGNTVTLSAGGGSTYSWTPSSGLSNVSIFNPQATPTITTTYTVYVSSANGCSDTAAVTVTVNPAATATVSPASSTICTGNNVTLSAGGGSNYSWVPSGTLSSATVSNPVATPTATTTYTVYVTNSSGCTDTAQATVTVQSSLTANAGSPASICFGNNTQLNASGGTNYSWSPATGLSNTTISNPVATPTVTTTYTVTVSSGNCSSTATVTITVNPLPAASAGNDLVICNGSNTVLTASGGTTYSWSPSSSLSSATGASVTAAPTATTTYTVVVTNASGCSDTAQVTVTVNPCTGPVPVISSSSSSVCDGSCISFTDGSSGSPTAWSWTFAGGTPSSSTQQNPGTVCFSGTGTHVVTLTVSNVNGTNTTTSTITVNPVPVATAGTSATINVGDSVLLSAGGGGTYSWAPSSGLNCTTCQNPTATPTVSTNYTVFVTQGGCTDTAIVSIIVNDQTEVFIPSGFSPNNDGQNDVFYVRGKGIKSIHLVIYDRIGEKVAEINDLSEGWDGTYKGQPMNSAVFVYYADIYFLNGDMKPFKGDLTLVR